MRFRILGRVDLCRPENAGEENSCEDQIEENLATYIGGGPPPYKTPELGYIWRSTHPPSFKLSEIKAVSPV